MSELPHPEAQVRLAGVVGQPIGHSLSPRLMAHWLEHAGVAGHYVPFDVAPDMLSGFVRGLAASATAVGVNVTLPHKEAALTLAGEASDTARRVGAANLLTFRDGQLHADNTDVAGFIAALSPAKLQYDQTSALVLGAGGAARALIHALLTAGTAELVLCNRNRERAERLRAELAPNARVADWEERRSLLRDAGLVVNATSLGLTGGPVLELDWTQAKADCVVFDTVYRPLETPFLAGARRQGLVAIDGLDMLIGQARPSFQAFFGVSPPPAPPVRPVLEAVLEGHV